MEQKHDLRTRIYRCVPGAWRRCCRGSERDAADLGETRHLPGGFWTTLIGKSTQEITYMLVWTAWPGARGAGAPFSPIRMGRGGRQDGEGGQLVENISSQLLAPTAFSGVK